MSKDNAELLRDTYESFARGDIPSVIGVPVFASTSTSILRLS